MTQKQDTTTDPLLGASTVAIVVHGVGDHSAVDILTEAEQGLSRMAGGKASTDRVKVYGLPGAEQTFRDYEALRITADNKTHVVVPLIWSNIRSRAATSAVLEKITSPVDRFTAAIPALFAICRDAFNCARKTRGIGLRIGVLAAALLLSAFVLTSWGLVIFLVAWLSFAFTTDDVSMFGWYDGVVSVLAISFVGWIAVKVVAVFDLAGDVSSYVGRQPVREQLEQTTADIITGVVQRAPKARILTVGHSLGSVLISHSLLRLTANGDGGKRIVLITLGSPLRLMSFLFRNVRSPKELASTLHDSGRIFFWANFWRDRDFIGKSLHDSPCSRCAEGSLGDGPHWNYWSDRVVWRCLTELLSTTKACDVMSLQKQWEEADLSGADQDELASRLRLAGIVLMTVVPFGLVVAGIGAMGDCWSDWPFPAAGFRNGMICLLWWANVVSVLAMYAFVRSQTRSLRRSARNLLGQLRFWSGPFWFAFWTTVITAASMGMLGLG